MINQLWKKIALHEPEILLVLALICCTAGITISVYCAVGLYHLHNEIQALVIK